MVRTEEAFLRLWLGVLSLGWGLMGWYSYSAETHPFGYYGHLLHGLSIPAGLLLLYFGAKKLRLI